MVQGDGITLSGDGKTTHKMRHFCRRYQKRTGIPPAPTKAIVAQRGASVAIPSRIVTDLFAEDRNSRWGRKIFPSGKASIAAGIPPAALLVGQKPEPTLIGIEKRR